MKICDILSVDLIKAEIESTKKEDVISELIDLFTGRPEVKDLEEIKKSVLEREKIMSTGVGKGFAVPHAKTSSVKGIIASFGKSNKDIDFNALDGEPVHLVFVLVGQDNLVGPHIKLLSRISRMMNKDEFREALLNAKTSEEIYEIFNEEEKKYFDLT
jgi:fructose-specific phosphotransferase system IIA component